MNAKSLLLIGVASLVAFAGCESRNQTGTPPSAPASPSQTVPKATVAPAQPAATPATRAEATPTTGPKPWMIGAEQGLKPTLLVATFESRTDDGLPWGAVVSNILRIKLNYAPQEILSIPTARFAFQEFQYLRRGARGNESQTVDEAIRLARLFGAARALTGQLEKRGEALRLAIQLRDAASSRVLTGFAVEGTVDQSPALIAQCALRLYEGLVRNADLSVRAHLLRPVPATGALLQREVVLDAQELTSMTQAHLASRKEICAADPSFVLAKAVYVNALVRVSREQSLAEAKRFHEADPHEGRLWELYIRNLDESGRDAEGIQECFRFLQENPNNLLILWQLARLYNKAKNYEDALNVATRLVELAPGNFRAHWMRAGMASDWGWARRGGDYWSKVPLDGKIIFPRMMELCHEEYEKAVAINPNNPILLANLANTYIQTGESESEIESLCRKAIAIESDNWDAYITLLLYYRPGYSRQHDKAVALCREAAERNPTSVPMQWLMAHYLLWYTMGDNSQTGISGIALRQKPEFREPMEQSIRRALALEPKPLDWKGEPAFFYERIGYGATQLGMWDETLVAARKGFAQNPTASQRESLLAWVSSVQEARGEVEAALKNWSEIIKMNGSLKSWALAKFAFVAYTRESQVMAQGFQYAKELVAIYPKESIYRHILARYHWKFGERDAALREANAALEINPGDPNATALKNEILAGRK